MNKTNQKKVLVAMSGGVDSSVAAFLLKKRGHEVVGVTMCLGILDNDDSSQTKCCGAEAINDAKKVCLDLDIPHYVLDFSKEMKEQVIDDFISEYKKGRTPNPCVRCNYYLKFGKLLDYAKNMEFDFLATGHYAKIKRIKGKLFLTCPKDNKKDQTYFLYCIKRNDLSRILFPLADYSKEEVRKIAKVNNLIVADKPGSQDVCFIPDKKYKDFLKNQGLEQELGLVVHKSGKVLGQHEGLANYTIGQRSGLGIAFTEPLYILDIDLKTNKIIVGAKEDLAKSTLMVRDLNILVDNFPDKIFAKIRYAHKKSACHVKYLGSDRLQVFFDLPQSSVTSGQSIVFYRDDVVLGGGIIYNSLNKNQH